MVTLTISKTGKTIELTAEELFELFSGRAYAYYPAPPDVFRPVTTCYACGYVMLGNGMCSNPHCVSKIGVSYGGAHD